MLVTGPDDRHHDAYAGGERDPWQESVEHHPTLALAVRSAHRYDVDMEQHEPEYIPAVGDRVRSARWVPNESPAVVLAVGVKWMAIHHEGTEDRDVVELNGVDGPWVKVETPLPERWYTISSDKNWTSVLGWTHDPRETLDEDGRYLGGRQYVAVIRVSGDHAEVERL